MENSEQQIARRASVIARHFMVLEDNKQGSWSLEKSPCLQYSSPESASEEPAFDIKAMRCFLDGHNVKERDWLFNLMAHSDPFCPRNRGGKVYVMPDYNQPMEHQRDMTMKRIYYLLEKGVFKGWLTDNNSESNAYKFLALNECLSVYDHSLAIKIGVHMHLWGGAIRFLGTERHHKKWLQPTEDFSIRGCFAMTKLGHGSNVSGIETCATYDPATKEFIINTPCESAQKYWIGGAANHATHTIVFSQLTVQGKNEGVHAFIVQIRDLHGNICPGVKIADCGHKIGLNGVGNGRIWFDRENLLNSVADVSPSGEYQSPIGDPDKRFAAFMAPLTFGHVTIATVAIYESKVGLATAIHYALSRCAFQLRPNEPEVLLLDYPAHQRRLLPLLAKIYAMSCAGNDLKGIYVKRTASDNKTLHVLSSGYKAMLMWHNMRTL